MRIEEFFDNLTDDLKEYAGIRFVSIKMSLVEKLSLLSRDILSTLVIFFLIATALFFALLAIVILISRHIGLLYSSLLVCAILVTFALVVYLFRKKLFTNIFVAFFGKIFFNNDTDNKNKVYPNVNSISELYSARESNSLRLKYIQCLLLDKFSSIRKSLHSGIAFINLSNDYLLFASHIRFYRRTYLLLRSIFFNMKNRNKEKKVSKN